MTNESRSFGFTYGYDDAVTEAMQERTYAWMDIIFVDFGEITGDCLLRKSRPAIVLSGTEYNESSPILTVAPMTRSLKGLDSKYHVFVDREDCNNELNTSGMCMLEHCQAIDRRQVKHKMLDAVKDAFEMIWEEQKEKGWTDAEIDGMTGFVFCNRYGNVMSAQSVNRAIKRISSSYNATEEVEAKKEHREPVLLPDFSAHSLRHTFCTRLCERETNLKVIQSIMGHKDIQTTMDIYAEATEEKKQETFEHLAATMDVF